MHNIVFNFKYITYNLYQRNKYYVCCCLRQHAIINSATVSTAKSVFRGRSEFCLRIKIIINLPLYVAAIELIQTPDSFIALNCSGDSVPINITDIGKLK